MEDKKLDFTYPNGVQKIADQLTFLPEEQRTAIVMKLASLILMQ